MPAKKLYIETYGCQMNVVDSEVVVAILQQQDYELTEKMEEADLVLVNTCSIRDNAEQKVRTRIMEFGRQKKINEHLVVGVIGCMAERLKEKLLEDERSVDLVVGPDAYRELPRLLQEVDNGQKGINTQLSLEETYADVSPVRLDKNRVSSFVSIMRGCNNFCAYCVVPYTRGRERSRDPHTIEREVRELFDNGYREVTLLGQNVNSYLWDGSQGDRGTGGPGDRGTRGAGDGSNGKFGAAGIWAADAGDPGGTAKKEESGTSPVRFEDLLERIANISPRLRVRFATSHPKDMSDELLLTMAKHQNLCRSIHLPVQSGSTAVLKRMKRGYTREMYEDRVRAIRKYLPEATISTDIIAGFCGETEAEHRETLELMRWAGFDLAYMFKYSERPDTFAAKKYKDDVPEEIKSRRLSEIIRLQGELSLASKKEDIGNTYEVLVEGTSKKSAAELVGRTSQNKVVVFPAHDMQAGDYAQVRIRDCTSATLLGEVV
ncbi:MAG: radical SAM protein [Bacteroidales bacterium]|nr:radical SAM protein [Bacteroidales bacterium]MDT8433114.1 radical SAM protein [Bacteroidales bacterium]